MRVDDVLRGGDVMRGDDLERRYARMQDILRELRRVAVAFSAGVDSTLVLKVAVDTLGPENVVAVTGRSDSLARSEFAEACALAESVGAEHVVLDTDEFDNPDYVTNPPDRCYHCKTALYDRLAGLVAERGLCAAVNGINADDLGDHRPGIEAAREHGVRAPAAEAGLTKRDVRALADRLGLANRAKPASPCLSSRIPYGEAVTVEKLRMIEAAEGFLHDLGFAVCRVRHHGDLARIEVPREMIAQLAAPGVVERVDRRLRDIGYRYVALDLRGFASGRMNEVITVGVGGSAT
ncbi:MAG: ATP-dependent sacrificial sulfur transferase LarE [Phycisphaerae bacterium]